MLKRTIYQRICKTHFSRCLQRRKSVSINHSEKQSLSPLENHCLIWEKRRSSVHIIDYQSYINIIQVHSSAAASELHFC